MALHFVVSEVNREKDKLLTESSRHVCESLWKSHSQRSKRQLRDFETALFSIRLIDISVCSVSSYYDFQCRTSTFFDNSTFEI